MKILIAILTCLLYVCIQEISGQTLSPTTYLEFSKQNDEVLTQGTNFATLKLPSRVFLSSNEFTICGSIYIAYSRGPLAFYTLRKSDEITLWFSVWMAVTSSNERYTVAFYYSGGSVLSSLDVKLRPHAWSTACTSVDMNTGQVTVVVNGQLAINVDLSAKDFLDNSPIMFQNNLILGAMESKLQGSKAEFVQSEASASNVNIFSAAFEKSKMMDFTATSECLQGDVLSWKEMIWQLSGQVQIKTTKDICNPLHFPHLFLFPNFRKQADCLRLCPRIQTGGRVPLIRNSSDQQNLSDQCTKISNGQSQSSNWRFWAPFRYHSHEVFLDFYTDTPIPGDIWLSGQPNGGTSEQCTNWAGNTAGGKLADISCVWASSFCLCQFQQPTILRLRGVCLGSNIDTHYTMNDDNGSNLYLGLTSTKIEFSIKQAKWMLSVNLMNTQAFSPSKETSYILGNNTWTIVDDSVECGDEQTNIKVLKMSGCTDGEFTCRNGDCVKMEERCDQILDCQDETDEVDCSIVVLRKSYRKTAPPVLTTYTNKVRKVVPVSVLVTMSLLDISAIRETDNEIDIKLTTELQWNESRAMFHNLKREATQNTLEQDDVKRLWFPNLVYRNNKENFDMKSGIRDANLKIRRDGSFVRSGLDTVDEIEIFSGNENPIMMIQSYTKSFKCKFDLRVFPFDTQVCYINLDVQEADIKGINLLLGEAKMETDRELTEHFITKDPKSPQLKQTTKKEVRLEIIFKRRITHEAMLIFFPSLLLIIISYATSFFKLPNFFNTAITINLTVMLTITTLLISVSKKLAETSYIKWIEAWLIFAQLIPFAQVILITCIEWSRDNAKKPEDVELIREKEHCWLDVNYKLVKVSYPY